MNLRTHRDLLVASAVVGALAYWRLVFWDPSLRLPPVAAWLFLPTDPFPQTMFPIAAALIYRRRESLRKAMQAGGSPALAALPLLAGSLLFLWAHYVDAMDLLLASFVLVSIGAGLLWFGTRFVRALTIPFIVLVFAIPAPATLANQAFYFLRLWTASHTATLLTAIGFPAYRHGNMIYGNDVVAQVVDTCSGLRSMEMLTLAAIIYIGWYPVRRARGVLLVVLSPAIAYVFNLVRVGVITLYPTAEYSRSHSLQGMSVFLGAVFGLVLLDRLLARLFPTRSKPHRAASCPEVAKQQTDEGPASARESSAVVDPRARPSAVALAVMLVTLLGVSIWMPQWSPPEEVDSKKKALLPGGVFAGWRKGETLEFDRGFFWTVSFSKHAYRLYERDGEELSVFIGYDDRKYRNRNVLSPKNAVPGRGWDIEEKGTVDLGAAGPRAVRVVAQSASGRILSYHWYEATERLASETVRAVLAMDQSPFRRSQPARVIRVTTELGSDPLDEAEFRGFASLLASALHK
jgi:EpsI family protein